MTVSGRKPLRKEAWSLFFALQMTLFPELGQNYDSSGCLMGVC